MSARSVIHWSGAACILGGLCIAAFVLIHPWDQLVGAAIARTTPWRLAHLFHFIGAAFALIGVTGLYANARERLGTLGTAGFVLAFLGNAMFLGTGMITAFIWPMLAQHAPSTDELDGPIFHTATSATAFLLTAALMIVGYVLFGLALIRAQAYPRPALIALIVGAILGMLPPHPATAFPWGGLVLGGVLYAIALAWLGAILWRENA